MNDLFFRKNDIRVNGYIAKALLFFVPVLPVLIITIQLGMVRFSRFEIPVLVVAVLVGLIVPFIMDRMCVRSELLKYFIITDISVVIAFVSMSPGVTVYIMLVLGIIISFLYHDPRLTAYACILDYAIMVAGVVLKALFISRMSTGSMLSVILTNSVEFFFICPIAYVIARITRSRMEAEQELSRRLEDAGERYELALDSSRDILYEYEIARDRLTYYGTIKGGRAKGRAISREPIVVEHFMSRMQRGHVLHPDDISLIEGIVSGSDDDIIQVRMMIGDDYDWFEIESNAIFNNNSAVKIVGKARNITEAKEEEQEFLNVSRKDSLTGFYDKIVGIRMIRRHMTQVGRTDSQQFMYVSLENAEEIGNASGSVFLDALLLRLADILKDEVSDMDLPVRFSKTEFVIYLVNRSPSMLEQMQRRIEQETSHVYVGNMIHGGMKLKILTFPTLSTLEQEVGAADSDPGFYETENDSYRNDMVSFAFNLLERTDDLDNAVNLLLDRMGSMYRLDSVRVMRGTSIRGIYRCVYEWRMAEADEEGITSILDTDVDIGGMRQRSDIFMYECTDLGDEGGYFVFQGDPITGGIKDIMVSKLSELARIMSTFIGKKYADSANRAKSDFLSSMSHEIRTPMNAIAGFAELILQESPSEVVAGYADNIKTSSGNLLSIINDILDLSKIESGKFEIIPDRYYLHEIVTEVRNIIRIQIGKAPVEFIFTYDEGICDGLIGDGLRIRQILINLLSNAVKFTDSGQVGLELKWKFTAPDAGVLEGVVWDTGSGIPEDEVDRIFSPYEQAEAKKNRKKGTGLGLAITKELVELMNGSIICESEYGKGTSMKFSIPQTVFDPAPHDYSSEKTTHTKALEVPFVAPWARVMLIDDNKVNIEVAKGLLSKYKVQMVSAVGGREALSILESDTDFDLIFMDHLMPEMDGVETAQAIRSMGNPILEKVPIVALTANAVKGVEETFIGAGMDGFLTKPIDVHELSKIMVRYIPDEKKEIQ